MLCVAAVVLWVRGSPDMLSLHRADDHGEGMARYRIFGVGSRDGTAWFFSRSEELPEGRFDLLREAVLPWLPARGEGWRLAVTPKEVEDVESLRRYAELSGPELGGSPWEFAGIGRYDTSAVGGGTYWLIPFAHLVGLCGLPAALRVGLAARRHFRRRARYRRGLCLDCGYDLRATPDRCPECGKVAGGVPAAGKEHAAAEDGKGPP